MNPGTRAGSLSCCPLLVLAILLWLPLGSGCGHAEQPASQLHPALPNPPHPSDTLFSGPIQTFELVIAADQFESLRREPRKSVPAIVRSGTNEWSSVGVRVKGAAGSTRPIDDLPALTLNVDKFKPGQKIFGLDKLHLNNSVQDGSRMSEIVCADLYRRAGVPATRATHALVRLNGRNLGLYVLKEGFDRSFLTRNFKDSSGNLYDGGFLRDIDQQLELDAGKTPPDWKDLQILSAVCNLPDAAARKAQLAKLVDVDRFLTYLALQVMTEDWDGYPCNRNNYRVYHDPSVGRFTFMPHGMDQMFSQGGMPLNRDFEGIVAARVIKVPEWRSGYFDRIESLLTNVFTTNAILATFDAAVSRREPALAKLPRGEADDIRGNTRDLRRRILDRVDDVKRQIASRPKPAKVAANGLIEVGRWQPRTQDAEGGRTDIVQEPADGRQMLRVELTRPGIASWRTRLELPEGRYRLEARAKVQDLVASPNERGTGLGVRLSGTTRQNRPQNELQGTTGWTTVQFEFALQSTAEVELVAEMRGAKGTGFFDAKGFRLSRLP
jgi:spore coat protein H